MNEHTSLPLSNEQIKTLLEATFEFVSVEGNSRVTKHGSGHTHFTLKDANSSIQCVRFEAMRHD